MDESGHDHKNTPYEVRGGVALHAKKVWPFVQAMIALETSAFGDSLHRYKQEIKGHKLLDKDRFKWASQEERLNDETRRKHCLNFLNKGVEKKSPNRIEFTAYGQACLEMARGVFRLLLEHEAVLFASAIPRAVQKPQGEVVDDMLRKDSVFLLERFFYFLENKRQEGLLVLDETEKTQDRRFVRQMHRYFRFTETGRHRTSWIVPSPFFVSSDMAYPVQAVDVCIYCVNWGFRLPGQGMGADTRLEIQREFSPILNQLQFRGDGMKRQEVYKLYGIVFVPDPYTRR